MNILERYRKPTPKFFRILRNIGLALATAGGTILASPVALPEQVLSLAAYITIAGTVASAICQAVVSNDDSTTASKNKDDEL